MANSWGEELNNAAGAFFGSDYLRDYTHASKTFRSDSYANAPKYKFLFHTYFNINPDAWAGATQQNLGILVKSVKLPSYRFNTTTLNQYNRKRIVQTKINYEQIQVTFHDDNNNSVNKMWYAYYTYYYKDASRPNVVVAGSRGAGRRLDPNSNVTQPTNADYDRRDIYSDDAKNNTDWGFIGDTSKPEGKKVPFFKDIRIFGFNQHAFTSYILINPIISSFSHDTYDYEQNSVMTNQMSIDYETVVYNAGAIDGRTPGDIVTGFGDVANYDRTQSPISKPGANSKVLGQGGLIDAAGGFFKNLEEGDLFGAVQTAGTAYNTIKNTNLKSTIKQEVKAGLIGAAQEVASQGARRLFFNFSSKGSTPSTTDTAGSPPPATQVPDTLVPGGSGQTTQYAGKQTTGGRG